MALSDLLNTQKKTDVVEVTDERVEKDLELLRELVAYWRWYPDFFIDYLCSLNPNNTFQFYYTQRMYLRAAMRYKTVYCTYPRGWSKSFLAVLCLVIKCILFPNSDIFVVSDVKSQSASILSSKINELCRLIPALEREIIWENKRGSSGGKTINTKDTVVYQFKNGSRLMNIALAEGTRGQRHQAGLMEEAATLDQELLNSVIIPTLVIRRNIYGVTDPDEVLNQSQIFITSAGYKGTYAYDKLIQTICESVARPDSAIVLGGTWRLPVYEGLQPRDFLQRLKMDNSYNEASFEREFESVWSGSVEGAFFDLDKINKKRVLQLPEWAPNGRNNPKTYYLLGVDVGRLSDLTEVVVIKVAPDVTGVPKKEVVNLFSIEGENFIAQSREIKKIFKQFDCKVAVVDGNGIGGGLVDLLVTDQEDPDTGELLPTFGVVNDDDDKYRNFITENTVPNAMYIMKANAPLNTEMFAYCRSQLNSGKLELLIDENLAKNKLESQSQSQRMSARKRAEYLQPFTMTSILIEQMLNLVENPDNMNIILKQNNKKIKKDKFSALIYGMYWCKLEEDKGNRKKRSLADYMFFS